MKRTILNAVAIVGILAGTPAFAATAAKPAAQPHVAAASCSQALAKSHTALAKSKASSEDIAMAWKHIDAARQARKAHQVSACVDESHAALKLLDTAM